VRRVEVRPPFADLRSASNARLVWRRFRQSPLAIFGLGVFVVLFVCAVAGPILPLADPYDQDITREVERPSLDRLMGSDPYGRDVLSRIVVATRHALLIGFASAGIAALIGAPLGLVAGFYGRFWDTAIMRLADTLLTFPVILLALVMIGSLGSSTSSVLVAFGVVFAPRYVRLVRASVLSLKSTEFVHAAVALGASDARVLALHILPNALSPVLVQFTANFAYAIVAETSLSFLGLGVQPPEPSWGSMLSEARPYIGSESWLALFPGLVLVIAVLGLNLLGDGLRDALDPRLRVRK